MFCKYHSKLSLHFTLCSTFLFFACTTTKAKIYSDALDKLLGQSKKEGVNAALRTTPARCSKVSDREVCEYRTSLTRNEPIPDTYSQTPHFGPDLSPLDYYDTVFVTFDAMGIFKDWSSDKPQ